ncbi:MAG: hypothetical protein M3Z04_09660 [Chloroflexota bacterium]|nr:hypothetical protein [Chloroflexota bacterium]
MAALILLVDLRAAQVATYTALLKEAGYAVLDSPAGSLTTPLRGLPRPALVLFNLGSDVALGLGQALALISHPTFRGVPVLLVNSQPAAVLAGRDLTWAGGVVTLPIPDADLLARVAQLITPAPGI